MYINLNDFIDWLVERYGNSTGTTATIIFEIFDHIHAMPKLQDSDGRQRAISAMRDVGMSYEQIADIFGVSKQRVHQVATREPSGGYFRAGAVRNIPYIGLREWMIENRVSISKLRRMCGAKIDLSGNHAIRTQNAEKILQVTGLSFEECFRRE